MSKTCTKLSLNKMKGKSYAVRKTSFLSTFNWSSLSCQAFYLLFTFCSNL